MSKEVNNKRTSNKHAHHMQMFQWNQVLSLLGKRMHEMTNSSTSHIWHDKILSMGTCNINSRPACVGVYIWWESIVFSSWKTSLVRKKHPKFLSALHGIYTSTKYLRQFDVHDNTVADPTGTENEVYMVQQKDRSSNFSGHV